MLRRNIGITLGLVNGTIATVTGISRDIDNKDVNTLTIALPSGKEYNIERVNVKFEVMDKAYVIRKQFPVSLSYGITIHKSQGLSLKSAVIDVGNVIFSCGQTYVALSRLTSIEGLHLINYDPASVKANELAIVEYNRLRKLYRPDIKSIEVQNCRYNKVIDQLWAIPVTFSIDQEIHAESKYKDDISLTSVKGFANTDNVSCYANAILQCIIHSDVIRKSLLKVHDEKNVMKLLINDYIGYIDVSCQKANNEHEKIFERKDVLNSMIIRQFLGDPFSLNVQQDGAEFLTALCGKFAVLKDTIEHDLSTTIHCTICNYTNTNTQQNLIAALTIPTFLTQSVDLQYLMKHNFSHWSTTGGMCENCKENGKLMIKYDIRSAKQVIVLQLMLFSFSDEGISKITKCNIKGVPTDKIYIGEKFYKVTSAIFHHGIDIDKGHYTNMLKDRKTNKSKWIHIDDKQILHKQWPRGSKNAYILFLEQCK